MTDNTYPNPVLGVPKEDRKVVTVDIIEKDWTLLKGCDLEHGSLTATFNILVNTLANECRKRGIIDFSKTPEFRELVQSVGFIPSDSVVITRAELDELRGLRDRTPTRSTRKSTGRNERRGTKSKDHSSQTTPNSTGLQSSGGTGDTPSKGQVVSGETGETS